MRVYLCDDNEQDILRMCRMLVRYAQPFHTKVRVRKFRSAVQLMTALEDGAPRPDLLLLDIFLDAEMNGVEAGERLRTLYSKPIPVIFITSSEGHALDAFRLHAVGYLHKPYTQEEFDHAMERVERLFVEGGRFLTAPARRGQPAQRIYLNELLYLESVDRGTRFYLDVDPGQISGKDAHVKWSALRLWEYREQLSDMPEFLECGRSYIVNLDHAAAFTEKGLCMDNGDIVPVPIRIRTQVAAKFRAWKQTERS